MRRVLLIIASALFLPAICAAAESRISVPLRNGRLTVAQVQQAIEEDLHLPPTALAFLPTVNVGVDLRSINDYDAGYILENTFGYKPFWHTEEWQDSFHSE